MSEYLEKNGNGFEFAAIKAALFNAALNAGIMLAATVAVKALVQELDNAAYSLEDVESRIQDNQTALSDYASKVEELTKKLEELNQTDVKYLSENEQNLKAKQNTSNPKSSFTTYWPNQNKKQSTMTTSKRLRAIRRSFI